MDELKAIRWKQRFSNFEKIYNLLLQYINKPIENDLERAGMIQFFEISFELAWKVMKDYLESQEIVVKSPRETIKQAYQIGLIDDGHIWMDALSDRNLTVHTYDEALARKMVEDIVGLYFPELRKFYAKMNDEKMKVEDL
ncbi:MAG: nucleotidyltransferase substrate binding protein [Proteocatella sp.]